MQLLIFLLLVAIYWLLVEIVFCVEVAPHNKGKQHCLLETADQRVSQISASDVCVQPEETAKGESPLDWSEGVRIPEDIFALEVVQLLDAEAIVLFGHFYQKII